MVLVKQLLRDPFRKDENRRAVHADAHAWRLAACVTSVLTLIHFVAGKITAGLTLVGLSHSALCGGMVLLARRRPAFYATFREAFATAGLVHLVWGNNLLNIYAKGGTEDFSKTGNLSMFLIVLNGTCGIWILVYVFQSRPMFWWSCILLPLAVAQSLWRGPALCGRLLALPGIEAPLRRFYRTLDTVHLGAALPLASTPQIEGPVNQCLTVCAWSLLVFDVALPLLIIWHLEQLARRRWRQQQQQQQGQERSQRHGSRWQLQAAAAEGMSRSPWAGLVDLYFISCAAWWALSVWMSWRRQAVSH